MNTEELIIDELNRLYAEINATYESYMETLVPEDFNPYATNSRQVNLINDMFNKTLVFSVDSRKINDYFNYPQLIVYKYLCIDRPEFKQKIDDFLKLQDDLLTERANVLKTAENKRYAEEIKWPTFRHEERMSLIDLFSGYSGHLTVALLNKLTYYHDDTCLSRSRNDGRTLKDMICKMTLAYKPNPITEAELAQNATLMLNNDTEQKSVLPFNIGKNGYVYKHTLNTPTHLFHGDTLITKASKTFNLNTLKEAVVNMCIINDYLEKNPYAPLVPTYGFFLCEQEQVSAGEPVRICSVRKERGDGKKRVFIVQRYMEGTITLKEYVNLPTATLERVQQILVRVLRTLIHLQNGPFNVYHGDLHAENILVTPDGLRCWIIDWGYASFTIEGFRYGGETEVEYTEGKEFINTGAIDIYFLLGTLARSRSDNDKIRTWSSAIRTLLFKNCVLMKDLGKPITDDTVVMQNELGQNILYSGGLWLYSVLAYIDAQYWAQAKDQTTDISPLHQKNVELLNMYTYDYLFTKLREIDGNPLVTNGGSLEMAVRYVEEEDTIIAAIQSQAQGQGRKHRRKSIKRGKTHKRTPKKHPKV
jgi:hypothetical protein